MRGNQPNNLSLVATQQHATGELFLNLVTEREMYCKRHGFTCFCYQKYSIFD